MRSKICFGAVTVFGTGALLSLEGPALSSSSPSLLFAECLRSENRLQQGVLAKALSEDGQDGDEAPAPIFPEESCTYPADNNFEKIITPAILKAFLEKAAPGFSYRGISHPRDAAVAMHKDISCAIQANSDFSSFCNTNEKYTYEESAFVNTSECTAFLAHAFVHTNSWLQFEDSSSSRECRNSEQYPCGSANASYHGRGALKIRGNEEYGRLSQYLFNDAEKLLRYPRLIQPQGISGWVASLWKWMDKRAYGLNCPDTLVGSGKVSCHEAMLNQDVFPQETADALRDNDAEKLTKSLSGFGLTVNILGGESSACCPAALKSAVAAIPKPVLVPALGAGAAGAEAAGLSSAAPLLAGADERLAGGLTHGQLKQLLSLVGAPQNNPDVQAAGGETQRTGSADGPSAQAAQEQEAGSSASNEDSAKFEAPAALGTEKHREQLFHQLMSGFIPPPPADAIPVQQQAAFLETENSPALASASASSVTRFVLPPQNLYPDGNSASMTPLSSAAATSAFLTFLSHTLPSHPTPDSAPSPVPLPSSTAPPAPFPLPGDASRLCTTRGVLSAKTAEANAQDSYASAAATAADTFCLSVVRGCPVMSPPLVAEMSVDQGDAAAVEAMNQAAAKNLSAVVGAEGEKCSFRCAEASNSAILDATNDGARIAGQDAGEKDALDARGHAEAIAALTTEETQAKSFDYLPKSGVVCGYTCVSAS
ncbi:chitinase-like protein CLP1 [Besnoitia besnoiti]|uniref:Chitinase-like protein CLP1 n=1 Tax=Besnoitia besnoiti TaxID=94643 RepID=A0A2A9M9P6_BESBE|nr:chitinase-like protein CLP1 [Besnoitia besnoiti]PFH32393.1 chitinase-like protein CLP1 [Besnoitia besnoiti]